MHVPIPAESASRGKPIFVNRAEGYGRFKGRVLILEETATVGWDRSSGLRIHNPTSCVDIVSLFSFMSRLCCLQPKSDLSTAPSSARRHCPLETGGSRH